MPTLKLKLEISDKTDENKVYDWLRGVPRIERLVKVREYELHLKPDVDLSAAMERLKKPPVYIRNMGVEVVDEPNLGITPAGLDAVQGEVVAVPEYEPKVKSHNVDDDMLGYAESMNGCGYRDEPVNSEHLEKLGCAVFYGASDDLVLYQTANDFNELSASGDTTYIQWDDNKKEFSVGYEDDTALVIASRWDNEGRKFETNAPSWATFDVMEGSDFYGQGLIVKLEDFMPFAYPETEPEVKKKEETPAPKTSDDALMGTDEDKEFFEDLIAKRKSGEHETVKPVAKKAVKKSRKKSVKKSRKKRVKK